MHHAYQAHRAARAARCQWNHMAHLLLKTVGKLLEKQATCRRICRRTLQSDRPANIRTCQTTHREPRPICISNTGQQDCCLFCEEEASGKQPLHAFQKLCITEELRTKALLMHDWKVLNKLTELWRSCCQ